MPVRGHSTKTTRVKRYWEVMAAIACWLTLKTTFTMGMAPKTAPFQLDTLLPHRVETTSPTM